MGYYSPQMMVPTLSIFLGVGVILLTLRLITRHYVVKIWLGVEDFVAVLGVAFTAGCTALQLWNAIDGTPTTVALRLASDALLQTKLKVGVIQPFIEVLACGCIKLSFLLFYRRIFKAFPSFDRISRICIGFIIVWTLTFFIAQLSICGNRMYYLWDMDQTKAKAYCGSKRILLLVFAMTSILTDGLILSLPIFYIRRLNMKPRKKWATSWIFFLGFISTFACLLRFVFLCAAFKSHAMDYGGIPKGSAPPPTWLNILNPSFWIMIEMWLGSWASNLLTMGPLFPFLRNKQWSKGSPHQRSGAPPSYELSDNSTGKEAKIKVRDSDAQSDEHPIYSHDLS